MTMLRLKYERVRRNLSQQDLGAKAHMSQATVSAIEVGRMVPTQAELERLADVLLISPPCVLMKPCRILAEPDETSPGLQEPTEADKRTFQATKAQAEADKAAAEADKAAAEVRRLNERLATLTGTPELRELNSDEKVTA